MDRISIYDKRKPREFSAAFLKLPDEAFAPIKPKAEILDERIAKTHSLTTIYSRKTFKEAPTPEQIIEKVAKDLHWIQRSAFEQFIRDEINSERYRAFKIQSAYQQPDGLLNAWTADEFLEGQARFCEKTGYELPKAAPVKKVLTDLGDI